MSESAGEAELDPVSKALWLIAFRRQQLQHRKNLLVKAQEFSRRVQPGDTEPAEENINLEELNGIQAELEELSIREDTLRRSGSLKKDPHDVRLFGEQIFPEPDYDVPEEPTSQAEAPENDLNAPPEEPADQPAPREKDVTPQDKLRRDSDWVKCESCSLVVQTVIKYRVTDTTWFMCGIFSSVGCLFGCCLLPFFLNYFKDVSHYCPNCNTKICNVSRF